MKFAHLSDLHLGKKVNQFSMLEDQKYILEQALEILEAEQVQGVLLAGDIYDKAIASAEAIALFDWFLERLTEKGFQVFAISGNHDSPERIAFGSGLFQKSGVHLSPVYQGEIKPIRLEDEFGELFVWLLPFLKPIHVRHFYPEAEITSYTEALETVISNMAPEKHKRNLLVAHQFVTGAVRSDSEEVSVGGVETIEVQVFQNFDYVALGHLHRAQNVGRETLRYCGTLLKYSFSESNQEKSVTIVELKEKGKVEIKTIPVKPLRDLVNLRGSFQELMEGIAWTEPKAQTEDYVHATLLEENDILNAFGRLASVYPNLMQMEYENKRTREQRTLTLQREPGKILPEDMFRKFYEDRNNQPLSEEQEDYLREKIDHIWRNEP